MLLRTPRRSSGTEEGSKPVPRSRTKTEIVSPATSAYRSIEVDPGVLGAVGERLARGQHQGRGAVAGRHVADGDDLDAHGVQVLDLGGDAAQRRGQRGGGRHLVVVQPGTQVALLGSGEPGDGPRVFGLLLDQREGLQHRVVQQRGDVRPLLAADPLLPLGCEVTGQPQQPGADDQRDPEDPDQPDDDDGQGELELPGLQGQQGHRQQDQRQPDDHPRDRGRATRPEHQPPGRVRGVAPPLTLSLVCLHPEHSDAEHGSGQGPDEDPAPAEPGQQEEQSCQQHAERDEHLVRGEPDRPGGPVPRARRGLEAGRRPEPVAILRHGQPQRAVQDDPEATHHRERDEGDPEPQRRDAEVLAEATADTADDPVVGGAVGAWRGGAHVGSIVTQRRSEGDAWSTRSDPDRGPVIAGPDQGLPRCAPGCRGSTMGT